ncbi:MAG: biotin/lipoyl-binding protein [Kineosporiaceae bacterium]|nr:biotin/lipoyl-binding protein [Kineosporiaceae bacterium]MBK7621991.1 biotin/lipoyl-binding protein [Kineosporiaceae bacterium]MBK8074303.1 biotin/lipoyl-binding protein [Kineosporiaceae bacterium]
MDVVFPVMSEKNPSAEGVVATWFVRDGEQVAVGQLIAEVQVDKVAMEVPAEVAGTVHLHVGEEAVVPQGTVIASIT